VGTSIGFIGIGIMGRHMARNLARAGHEVAVHDVRPEALGGMAGPGLRVAASVADAVRDADVAITMLPDTPQAQDVLLGPGGVLEAGTRGGLVIEMSTISASATRDMAARLAGRGIAMPRGRALRARPAGPAGDGPDNRACRRERRRADCEDV